MATPDRNLVVQVIIRRGLALVLPIATPKDPTGTY